MASVTPRNQVQQDGGAVVCLTNLPPQNFPLEREAPGSTAPQKGCMAEGVGYGSHENAASGSLTIVQAGECRGFAVVESEQGSQRQLHIASPS